MRDKLEELQAQVRELGCPRCYHTELDIRLRWDFESGEGLYVAQCQHCGYTFELDTRVPSLDEMDTAIQDKLRQQGCPRCGSQDLEISFLCTLLNRECVHVVTCRNCRHTFVAEAPAEQRWPVST